ncbi:MAG: FAD-dependent monooxygenase [Boseongicola sp.]
MERRDVDIFISGGGIAGLVAAASFSRLGLSVIVADPVPPPKSAGSEGSDLRSTAFLEPAQKLLADVGVWSGLSAHATPLEKLRVIDCQGDPPAIRTERAFQSADLGAPAFGWNLPNWLTRNLLTEQLVAAENVDLRLGTGFRGLLTREREAIVTLTDDTQIRARLAIAADGRDSPLRKSLNIPVKTTRYGQKALAFTVAHDAPHTNTSIELYLSGGAFTVVPLPNHDGDPASAVVWMNDGPDAARLMMLGQGEFETAITQRSCGVLGQLHLISPRSSWPVVTQRAESLAAERTALIAEAAHVLPPIGAQGLNTSLSDIAALRDLASTRPQDIGTPGFLDDYAKQRAHDIRLRANTIDLYNRVCRSNNPPVQSLRSLGLRLAHDITPLRRGIMRAGLGG